MIHGFIEIWRKQYNTVRPHIINYYQRYNMIRTSTELLESYIKGKDFDEYMILENIYDVDAEVLFDIATNEISFPDNVKGNKEIARILSKDFNQNYEYVKTYYLSRPLDQKSNVLNQKWLVVMRDVKTHKTRVGTGYYDWHFIHQNGRLKIRKHKIYIHCMFELEDENMTELSRIQTAINYPWASEGQVCDVLKSNSSLNPVTSYLK